jgi:hypothetical protein
MAAIGAADSLARRRTAAPSPSSATAVGSRATGADCWGRAGAVPQTVPAHICNTVQPAVTLTGCPRRWGSQIAHDVSARTLARTPQRCHRACLPVGSPWVSRQLGPPRLAAGARGPFVRPGTICRSTRPWSTPLVRTDPCRHTKAELWMPQDHLQTAVFSVTKAGSVAVDAPVLATPGESTLAHAWVLSWRYVTRCEKRRPSHCGARPCRTQLSQRSWTW